MKKDIILSVNMAVLFIITCFVIFYPMTASSSPGSIDLSFGTGGKVKTDFNSSSDQATASAIYTAGTHAGKIVVAGMVMNASNYDTFGVARYNANGTLDTTFDTDGKAPTVDLTGYFSRPWGVAIQSDDKIVVVGAASWGSPTNRNDLGVVRYNANGSLDTTFDGDGKMTRQVGLLNSSWQAVAIQSDGKILIAGQSYNGADISTIVRLNANGSYDTSFTASVSSSSSFNAIAVQTDGKIIAAGWAYDGTKSKMVVVRFTSAGALDTSFNATGIQLLNGTKAFGTGGEGANALAIQLDGKILVGGTTDVSGQNAFGVARLNTDGSLDTSFNTTGKAILDPTTGSDSQKGIGVQSDGKIVLSGYGTGPSGNFDFIAARLNSGGTIDTSFGSSGYVFIDFGDDDRGDAGLVIQSDNNSVIAGWSGSGAARDFALVRLNAFSTNMVYASSTVAQNTNVIAPGATGDIVNIAITMSGDLSALTATSFTCNTTGTTTTADISSARLYYTGTTAAFSTATPFGSAVASPSGSFTITGTQALAEGTNYFWLAYAVAPGATNGNVLDAQCTSVTVGGTARTPSVTAPVGNRQIYNILAIYDIGTHIPVQSGGPNYVVPGSVASGITAANLTAGPSMTTDTFYTDTGSYLFMNWTTSTANDAGQYFQTRITPDALKQITYNKVAFSVAGDNYASGTPKFYGPTTIDLRYSTDDFASSNVLIQTLTWTPTAESFQQVPFDVDISSIGTRSGPITFRWYGYKRNAAGDSTSTMGFTNLPAGGQAAASGTGSNVIFKGTVSSTNTAPTDISLSASSINENVAGNSAVGSLTTTDPDTGNTFTYTLVTGAGDTDNASFNISGSSLRITNSPDFETKSSYSVRVRTTDQGSLFFEKAFTITINNVNETPTDIALSASSINENVLANSTVGSLSSTDPDAGNFFTYTLVAGTGDTDNASFNISGSSLRITNSPDYEAKSSYSVRVRTTDQGSLTYEKAFTITINNVNETPTDISLSASSINENVADNSTVGSLSTTDPDAGNTFTYTLVTGTGDTDNASFNISGSSLRISSSPDFETKGSYSVRVRSTDQGSLTYEKAFTISIDDLNEAPTDIALSASMINENALANSTVGSLSSTDPDAGNTFTYALVAGIPGCASTGNSSFNIATATLRTSAVFDYEAQNSYSVCIRTMDSGGLTFDKQFTITVTDVNDGVVRRIIVDPADSTKLIAGIDSGGIWRSANNGGSWAEATVQPSNKQIKGLVVNPLDSAVFFAATYGGGVFKSIDSADNWSVCANTGLGSVNATSLAIDPTGKLYAGTEAGIFASSGCETWSAINTGLTIDPAKPPVAIAIDMTTPANLIAGFDGAGIFVSTNSGDSWSPAATQPANLNIKALILKDPANLYAATYGNGVFKSSNSGTAWSACGVTGLTNQNIVSFTIDAQGKLYAGTEAGVFMSNDGCASWHVLNTGLPL